MNSRKATPLILILVTVAIAGVAWLVAAPKNGEDPATAAIPATAMPMKAVPLAEFVAPADSLPRLRFFDGDQVSLNDRCPVRKVRLNPKMAPAYVNSRPVGFC